MVLPGAGQLYVGARRRGFILLGITAAMLLAVLVLASWISVDAVWGVDRRLVATMLAVDLALLAFRLFAVVDASRGSWAAGLAVLVALDRRSPRRRRLPDRARLQRARERLRRRGAVRHGV